MPRTFHPSWKEKVFFALFSGFKMQSPPSYQEVVQDTLEVIYKSPNNNFTDKMQGYVMTLIDFYKKDLGNKYEFQKNVHTQLNTQWKCSLSVVVLENYESNDYMFGNRTHSFTAKVKYGGKIWTISVFLYDYKESNNSVDITISSTSGLEFDELLLLKQLVILAEAQTDKVHFLLGVMGKCYSLYTVLIMDASPTWVTNMAKRAILQYKGNYYFFGFGKSTVTTVTVGTVIFKLGR